MSTEPDVMVVDDDEDFREATYELLVDTGIKVEKFSNADLMLAALAVFRCRLNRDGHRELGQDRPLRARFRSLACGFGD